MCCTMAPASERPEKNSPKSKLLTMDVRELTLLLKSIGFRLESIDYDDVRNWHKKSNENGIASSSSTTANSGRTDGNASIAATDQHYINVEISCSKSKIVSNLSLRFNDCETTTAAASITTPATPSTSADAQAHTTQAPDSPLRMIACSCPKREPNNEQNSFWEVQSSGSFVNQRRSITSFINPDSQIDHDASSNLLPVLSTKSIALTNILTQVLLNQYKNTRLGETNDAAMGLDMKSILRAIENTDIASVLSNEKQGGSVSNDSGNSGNSHPSGSSGNNHPHVNDLNLITPTSSMNTTSTEPEDAVPKVIVNEQSSSLNETVNTEAFGSPKSPFTSSPNSSENTSVSFEREAYIINHLKKARESIDRALMSVRSNVSKNLTHDVDAAQSGLLSVRKQSLSNDNIRKRTVSQPQVSRMLNNRNTLPVSTNASTLNRRASIGVTRLAKPAQSTANRLNSSSVLSRSATATPVNGTNAQSKVALVRKTASIGTRLSNIAASAKTTLLSATPTTQAASLKRPSLISRRSTGKVTNGNTPSTSTASTSAAASSTNSVRKTGTTSKLAPPPKNVNK